MRPRLIAVLIIAAAAILVPAAAAGAHPLGNFTVNTYSGLRVAPDYVRIDGKPLLVVYEFSDAAQLWGGAAPIKAEIQEGLRITGHFIARDLLIERQSELLAARERLVERLKRASG